MLILSFGLIKRYMDKRSFENIHTKYFQQLFYYALKSTGDEQAANEAVSDTFMIFREKWKDEGVPNETAVKCFLYRTLKNNLSNIKRKILRNSAVPIDTNLKLSTPDHTACIDLKKDLIRVVDSLKEDIKEVIKLRLFGDLPFSEIAEILEVPSGTARRKYHEGLIRIRVELESYLD